MVRAKAKTKSKATDEVAYFLSTLDLLDCRIPLIVCYSPAGAGWAASKPGIFGSREGDYLSKMAAIRPRANAPRSKPKSRRAMS